MKKIKNTDLSFERKYIKKNTDIVIEKTEETGNDKLVFMSIKNIQSSCECFSKWTKDEMKKFWTFNESLHRKTWKDVYASASQGADKRGLAYTIIPRNKYEHISFMNNLSKDITLFELRVDNEMRVHGFRDKSIFYLCLLDREHKITKG